jgi:hypothetical protein
MCDKIDGWNPADIEAGGEGIEGYQAMMQGRQGGFIQDATTADSNSTGVADTVKKGIDAVGIGKIPFVGGAAKFLAGDAVAGLADDAVNVVGHTGAAIKDMASGNTADAAGQVKSAVMPAVSLGLTAMTGGVGGALAKGGVKSLAGSMAKRAATDPLSLVQAGVSGLQDVQDRGNNTNNLN